MKTVTTTLCSLWLLLATAGCVPREDGQLIPLPTRICLRTQHHQVPLRDVELRIKFNTDTFPGYLQPVEYFDIIVRTGPDARACVAPVPEGRHWVIAFGVDETAYPLEVFGNLPLAIALDRQPVVDTILYVSEQH
jgi:hypothetical protein